MRACRGDVPVGPPPRAAAGLAGQRVGRGRPRRPRRCRGTARPRVGVRDEQLALAGAAAAVQGAHDQAGQSGCAGGQQPAGVAVALQHGQVGAAHVAAKCVADHWHGLAGQTADAGLRVAISSVRRAHTRTRRSSDAAPDGRSTGLRP